MFHFDIETLLKSVGYLGIFLIIFAESGLLIGFFLPGDSLLFTAGFLASQGYMSLPILLIGAFIAAVLGDSIGYAFGNRVGPHLFKKKGSLLFSQDNLKRSEEFYKKYGKLTIILARFTPIVRTFAPILAGVGSMHYRTFVIYNIMGGFLWAIGLTSLGYFLGSVIPDIDSFILPVIAIIIILSIAPAAYHLLKDGGQRTKIARSIRFQFQKLFRKS